MGKRSQKSIEASDRKIEMLQSELERTQKDIERMKKQANIQLMIQDRTDMRTRTYAKRLQQMLVDRRNQPPPTSLAEGVCETAGTGALSGSGVCSICLDTEDELGKAFPFVFAGCGHKCLCKSCLRKMKKKKNRNEIECPLCRQCSKPV